MFDNAKEQNQTQGERVTQNPEKQIQKNEPEDGLAYSQVVESLNLEGSRVSTRAGKAGRQKRVIRTDSLRLGKDEMNLIEHPFAVLWQKEPNDNIMTLEWDARHPKTGKAVPASWSVAGHADFGLPTPTDERVYLVLLELTREANFEAPTVRFSRYDICKRLGWQPSPKSYVMIQSAFDRLKGVTITAKNAFWNPKSHSFRNTGFNIIDYYDINAEPPGRKSKDQIELPLSWFKWSDVMFDSFQSGYIRTLDLDFALGLKGDIALRLYRYLDKKAYNGRDTFEIELFTLCIEHLGMKPTKYPSKLKERLLKAHDELKSLGFLREVSYGEMKKPLQKHRSVKVCYSFNAHHLSLDQETTSSTQTEQSQLEQPPLVEPPAPDRSPEGLRARMMQIGVSPETIEEFLQNVSSEILNLQLDCLRDRNPKDAAATFVKAVRENWAAPTKYTKSQSAETNEKARQAYIESENQKKAQQEAAKRQEIAADEADVAHLDEVWEDLDNEARDEIEIETRDRLGVLFQEGKNSAAFAAMRRQIQREFSHQSSCQKT